MSAKPTFEKFLVENAMLTPETLQQAQSQSQQLKMSLSQYLIEKQILSNESLSRALAKYYHLPFQQPPLIIDPQFLASFPAFTLRRFKIIPLCKSDQKITVACTDPGNVLAFDEIRKLTGLSLEIVCTTEAAILDVLGRLQSEQTIRSSDGTEGVLEYADELTRHGIERFASDIHIEPGPNGAQVRERIDGMLYDAQIISVDLMNSVISRFKVLSGMDIVEKRLPQDGRFTYKTSSAQCEIRTSTLPTIHGEKVVLRLLRSDNNKPTLEMLDLGERRIEQLRKICNFGDGLVLVAGPTGCGKTTTIYALLSLLDRRSKNLITVEDPVEYELERANQVQINSKVGVTFSTTLPYILRQDPDILMIGEIREEKTAQIALRAAITGHLVFSTVHAPGSIHAVTRLCDMGVAPHLVAAAFRACLSQRLLRKLCPHCKRKVEATDEVKGLLGVSADRKVHVFEPAGCSRCHDLGYNGRFAVMELLSVSEDFREAILNRDRSKLKKIAKAEGFQSLREHAIERVLAGDTSVNEMLAHCS